MTIKALSIQQPWAWAILHAGKDVENRDWPTRSPPPEELPTGGIVGQAELIGCGEAFDDECPEGSPWFFGRYGFDLVRAKPVAFRPCKGRLGFFEPDYNSVYKRDLPPADVADLFSGACDDKG